MIAAEDNRPRPPGLTVLAVFNLLNFLAAAVYLIVLVSDQFTEPPGLWTTILASVSGLLAVVSAIGLLRRHYVAGFLVGNAFGVFLLVYSVAFVASRRSMNPLEYFAWFSYPVILLVLLNLFYRREFEDHHPQP